MSEKTDWKFRFQIASIIVVMEFFFILSLIERILK